MCTLGSTITLSSVRQKKIEGLFLRQQYKLRSTLKHKGSGEFSLGIDILRDTAKRDLLKFISLNLETTLLDIMKKNFTSFDDKAVLLRLIKISSEDFLRAWCGSEITIKAEVIVQSSYFKLLVENSAIILRLPFLTLLRLDTKIFHSTFYPIYTAPSDSFLEVLFDNLLIEISNCVVSLMLDEFSEIDSFRQMFYRSRFLSARNLDRFKNSLVWQTQLKRYIDLPKNLYNSQYGIWRIRSKRIYYRIIYANRSNQLVHLESTSLLTVTAIEIFDFLLNRFGDLLYLFGDTIRVTFGKTIGTFIAIIWRGIIDDLKK